MVRTQIQLDEEQHRRLKAMAVSEGMSVAALIRRGVDVLLATAATRTDDEVRRCALAASGRFRSGVGDLSTHHNRYLEEAYRE